MTNLEDNGSTKKFTTRNMELAPDSVKIDSRTLTQISLANGVNVTFVGDLFYLDFTTLDPMLALKSTDSEEPLTKSIVSRVSIGPSIALALMHQIAAGLAFSGEKVTLILDQKISVNSDDQFGPVVIP